MEDQYVQSFPKFGVERRGAPVEAFLRVDKGKILLRNNIYKPDHIIVLDPTLIEAVDVTTGLAEGGWVLINTDKKPQDFPKITARHRVACVNASEIALKYRLGTRTAPIVNTAILGAFAKITEFVKLESVMKAIKDEVPIKAESNANAAKDAFNSTYVS
jgi:2-oxoacid:acceptor oxidoreductase gamma subunit (pyruvate/2-ketoisovalerate family)